MKVLVTEFMDETALDRFGPDTTVVYDPDLVADRDRLLAQVRDAQAIIVRNKTQVDIDLLNNAPKLQVVGRLGVGLDNIDVSTCKDRNITVCPATGANAISVAEYVICAAMTLARGAYSSTNELIAGQWPRGQLGTGGEVHGRTIGLYGFGVIAQEVVPRAAALGMNIAAHDPFLPGDHPAWHGVKNCTGDALIAQSDVLSLHVPLTDTTRNLIGTQELERFKPGAILINTSRGGIVDEKAVAAALSSGKLGGAALDVFQSEPLADGEAAIFADVPNLILTPHISGVTKEANIRVSNVTVRNVMDALRIGTLEKAGAAC